MAAKRKRKGGGKRRASSRRRTSNPKHRRRSVSMRSRRTRVTTRRRRSNPKRYVAKRRRGGRRRNPGRFLAGGVTTQVIVDYTGGALLLGIVSPLVSPLLSPITRFAGRWAGPANLALTGVGVGWLLSFFGPTKRFSAAVQVLGISGAVLAIVTPFVRGLMGGAMAAANNQVANGGMGRFGYRNSPRGIAAVSTIPPQIQLAPPPSRRANGSAANNVAGIAATPGFYRR